VTLPLISCVMVTRSSRLTLAREALADFARQTYASRDLVVVIEGDDPTLTRTLSPREQILALADEVGCGARVRQVITVPPGLPLGTLRNRSLRHADAYWAQWDDDDRYHPERLAVQWQALQEQRAAATVLVAQVYQLWPEPLYYVVDWRLSPTVGSGKYIPGTILCRNQPGVTYPEHLRLGEDTVYLQRFQQLYGAPATVDRPGLYVRRWHGNQNATQVQRFRGNIRDRGWDRFRLTARFDELQRDLAAYTWTQEPEALLAADGQFQVRLVGRDVKTM